MIHLLFSTHHLLLFCICDFVCKPTQLRFIYQTLPPLTKDEIESGITREQKLRDLSNVVDDVSGKDLDGFVAGRNPLHSVTTPLHSTDEGSYEATAVLYAASANDVPDLGVIYGAGTGSTQISAVQNGAIVGTSFYELGSKIGIGILEKSKKDPASLKAAVAEWGETIKVELETWTIKSASDPDIGGQKSTDFLRQNSKNKTVVGISAVFYSMAGTKEINQIDGDKNGLPINQNGDKIGLPRIKQPCMVAALKKKLEDLLNFVIVEGTNTHSKDGKKTLSKDYKTQFENFDNGSGGEVKTYDEKKFLTELANVQLHLIYAEMLYHPTATFTLAREWKVHGKPFRTTWSTGWYVPRLPVPATTVMSALLTPSTRLHTKVHRLFEVHSKIQNRQIHLSAENGREENNRVHPSPRRQDRTGSNPVLFSFAGKEGRKGHTMRNAPAPFLP